MTWGLAYLFVHDYLFFFLRMVTFSNNVEPANGFLVRYLHRKLMESEDERNLTNENLIRVLDWVPKLWYHLHTFLEKHSTSDFLIGMKNDKQNIIAGMKTQHLCDLCDFFFSHTLQALVFFYLAQSQLMSFDLGSLIFGTTLLFHICKKAPRTASRYDQTFSRGFDCKT